MNAIMLLSPSYLNPMTQLHPHARRSPSANIENLSYRRFSPQIVHSTAAPGFFNIHKEQDQVSFLRDPELFAWLLEAGTGGVDLAAVAFPADDLGSSHIVHFSVALGGFFNMHIPHVQSLFMEALVFAVGTKATDGRVNENVSSGRLSASVRTVSEGQGEATEMVKVKNGKAGLAIFKALSLAER